MSMSMVKRHAVELHFTTKHKSNIHSFSARLLPSPLFIRVVCGRHTLRFGEYPMQGVYGRRHVHDRRQDRLHQNGGHSVQSRPVCGRHILLRFGEYPMQGVYGRRHVHDRRQDRLYRHEGHCVQRESLCPSILSLNEMCELYAVIDSARQSRNREVKRK
jgi:hypothetical protein